MDFNSFKVSHEVLLLNINTNPMVLPNIEQLQKSQQRPDLINYIKIIKIIFNFQFFLKDFENT